MRGILIWTIVCAALVVPIVAATQSPLLAWREPMYVFAGFAGIFAMALMLLQPLLAGGYLPGMPASRGRRLHRWVGLLLVVSVVLHIAGLWVTSPPDVIDVLLFRSPTPFGIWGALAMWAVIASAALAIWRVRGRPQLRLWRKLHSAAAIVAVVGTIVHALLIEGTMEIVSKVMLAIFLGVATAKVLLDLKIWKPKRT